MKIIQVIGVVLVTLYLCDAKPLEYPENAREEKDSQADDECEVKLNFSNMGMSNIKPNFVSGLKIKSLTLRYNSIEKFEKDTFDSLPNLEYLDLSHNKLSKTKLFSFGSVTSLKTLILDYNFGDEVIGYSQQCTNPDTSSGDYEDIVQEPECVSIPYEKYSALETNGYFPEVTHLSLRHIFMNSLAIYWTVYFPKVENLDVSDNRLSSVHDFYKNLPTTLKNLTMENMGFTSMKIPSLKNVTSLNLNLNHFHVIKRSGCDGESLCLENLEGLESLSIASCSIGKVEAHAFKHVMKLSYLDISNNSLDVIPDGTFGHFPSLSYLDISQNPFVNVSFIGELKNLTSLMMNGMKDNRAIESLWSMTSMPMIQIISLRDNGIIFIPSRFFGNLQDIREIDLSNNRLSFLSPGLWQKSLTAIHLNQNQVTKIEDLQLTEATSLQLLDLEKNNVTNIKLSAIKELPDTVILRL
ncbi:hypothetical protein QAD02_004513 [Eretmocerus hayati]|uniref:Uncharacterized protein n=1 Tax=Eretmocerus hayati TaxID=131215 RepID=A0ACC2NQ34_9HYME|nr:hypothetical protein QAD02_004513 [Eretmocerus hayati]